MSIKNWKEDDRPREKFYHKGKQAVSDSELLAILIGMGNKEHSALDIAKKMLASNDNSLENLGKLSIQDLIKYKGIGPAKAVSIAAALELGNRKSVIENIVAEKMNSSNNAFHLFKSYFAGLVHEEFHVAFLARNLKPIKVEKLSKGGTSMTIVDVKILTKWALDNLASAVIIAHNHPSGNLLPSTEDDAITEKIKIGLQVFDIALTDHIIICENKYYSYRDEGKL
jgi:DNA repair protein RadC